MAAEHAAVLQSVEPADVDEAPEGLQLRPSRADPGEPEGLRQVLRQVHPGLCRARHHREPAARAERGVRRPEVPERPVGFRSAQGVHPRLPRTGVRRGRTRHRHLAGHPQRPGGHGLDRRRLWHDAQQLQPLRRQHPLRRRRAQVHQGHRLPVGRPELHRPHARIMAGDRADPVGVRMRHRRQQLGVRGVHLPPDQPLLPQRRHRIHLLEHDP